VLHCVLLVLSCVTKGQIRIVCCTMKPALSIWFYFVSKKFHIFAAWTMHFQIMMKERPTKFIFKVNHIFRISILLLHVSALQECHLQGA
jgi:energy-converting hydrogenase Eha subunit A